MLHSTRTVSDDYTDLSSAAMSTLLGCGPETVVLMSVAKFFTTISITDTAQLAALTVYRHTRYTQLGYCQHWLKIRIMKL